MSSGPRSRREKAGTGSKQLRITVLKPSSNHIEKQIHKQFAMSCKYVTRLSEEANYQYTKITRRGIHSPTYILMRRRCSQLASALLAKRGRSGSTRKGTASSCYCCWSLQLALGRINTLSMSPYQINLQCRYAGQIISQPADAQEGHLSPVANAGHLSPEGA